MKRKKTITLDDYLLANRKASREEEIALYRHPLQQRRVHKSKKVYDRNKTKAGDRDLPFLLALIDVAKKRTPAV